MGKKSENHRKLNNPRAHFSKNRKLLDGLVDKLLKEVSVQLSNDKLWDTYLVVSKIIDEIKEYEGSEETKSNDRNAAIDAFIAWMKDNQVNCEDIEICEFPGVEFGLKGTKEFIGGDLILSVPRKLMITEHNAKKSLLGNLLSQDPILKNMPNVALSMYLLLQKNSSDSFWKPYIDILPSKYNTILYFSAEDFTNLKGSPVFTTALKLFINISRQFAYFYKLLNVSIDPVAEEMRSYFTFDQYRWAVSTVMTRQNMVPSDGQERKEGREDGGPCNVTALIPLWDMCNHIQGEITTDFNMEKDRAECYALCDFKKDDQIFIYYGVRTNAFFFLHNGFVYEDNKQDSMGISLGVSNSDPLRGLKAQVLEGLALPLAGELAILSPPHPLSSHIIAFTRILLMSKEQLEECIGSGNYESLLEFKPSKEWLKEHDKKVYIFINTRCKLILQTYQQYFKANSQETQNMDNLTLQDNDSCKEHRSMIRQLKKCEMKLLEGVIEFTKQ